MRYTAEPHELLRHGRRECRVHALRLVTDRRSGESGESTLVVRKLSSQAHPLHLTQYFSSGTSFYEHSPGAYRMVKADKREKIVVIASEPLTFEKADWMEVASNTLIVITPRMNVLQFPIQDEYFVAAGGESPRCLLPRSSLDLDKLILTCFPPTDAQRSPAFALKTGFSPNIPLTSGSGAPGATRADAVTTTARGELAPLAPTAPSLGAAARRIISPTPVGAGAGAAGAASTLTSMYAQLRDLQRDATAV